MNALWGRKGSELRVLEADCQAQTPPLPRELPDAGGGPPLSVPTCRRKAAVLTFLAVPELGAETQEQPWLAEGDPTSSSPTSGPPGPSLGGGGGRQSPLTAGCPLLRGCAVLRAGACLLLHRRPGLIGLVVFGGDQLHQALVADVGYLLDV